MKRTRMKYSKANLTFSNIVNKIEIGKSPKVQYNNIHEKRLKYSISMHAQVEKEHGFDNIFIETEDLYSFFSKTQINTRADIAQQVYFSLKNRKYIEVQSNDPRETRIIRQYVFRLYAPINLIPTSLAVCISCTETFEEGLNFNYILFTDKRSSINMVLRKEEIESMENGIVMKNGNIIKNDHNLKLYEYQRVILNLIFYMNAYPENVVNGVPNRAIIDEDIVVANKKLTISQNTELFENLRKSPHLRQGHLRTFISDYFTNKKGQTIWINPVFIKGEAITVTENENIH